MRLANCVFLACFGLISVISVCVAEGSSNSTDLFLPSQIEKLNCPGQANCSGDQCNFNRTTQENEPRVFYVDMETQIKCKDLVVHVNYPKTKDQTFKGQENFTCFFYKNVNGSTFSVVEFTLNEPSDVNGTMVTCTAEKSNCTLRNDTTSLLLYVAGLPSSCVPWTAPTSSPATTMAPTPTPTGQSTSTSKSDSSTTNAPGGNGTTPGTPGETTTASTPGDKTTTTTAKPGGNGVPLEGSIILLLGATLFAHYYV